MELQTIIEVAAKSPKDIKAQLQAADMEIANGGVEEAFNRLLHLVKETTGDERTKVREHLLTLFTLVDPTDPRLLSARSALANALY